MKVVLYYTRQGRVVKLSSLPEDQDPREIEGLAQLITDAVVPIQSVYVQDGEVRSMGEPPSEFATFDYATKQWVEDVEAAKWQAKSEVDEAAGAARSRHITTVPGQSEVYLSKYEDATAYQSDPDGDHPWVEADAGARGIAKDKAAKSIIEAHKAWLKQSVAIEQTRTAGKTAVDEAATVRAALEAAETTVNALNAL
jgi:hypothetical protein